MARGADGAFHFGTGGVISAHCVNSNGEHVRPRLFFDDFDHFAPLILAAVRTNAMRQFGLVTVGALGEAGRFQRVVGTAVIRSPLRVSAFRIRHSCSFLFAFSPGKFRDSIVSKNGQEVRLRRAAQRSSCAAVLQSQAVSLRLRPQTGQMPWHSSRHTRCMGSAKRTCSRRISSSSKPSPS
jgi:hypothetical protein